MNVRYIVLEYCPVLNSSSGRQVAVVTMPVEIAEEHGLTIYTVLDWSNFVDPKDARFIREVLDDLRDQPPDESRGAFSRLMEMSSGYLRTGAQGSCDESHLADITGIKAEA